ncbi:group III truncated hemoglobin [Fulvivirgaceae bacterium BMA10]|uniref:Group III truncated hemoglobin n=1 Tax=Splendidivirga corallicola TaxID=3051826 RepID=A0ABT8KMT9_9BACT|nr:group III truncated hemoglobin [Fulvivirgaceae bacterium BMA10]
MLTTDKKTMDAKPKEIEDRNDVGLLVHSFYARVRQDELIGPIFNNAIHDWDEHLEKLTDFWETNLFFQRKYKGNPLKKHQEVDENINHGITQEHFGRWLQIWFQTIDELFTGERANQAKHRARNMSTFMFIKIFQNR